MKYAFLFAALVSSSGFASQLPNPLLTLDAHAGFVPAHLAWSSNCRVYANEVQLTVRKANQLPSFTRKPLRFTAEVKNVREISRLVLVAKRGQIVSHIAPTDGNSYHYQAVETVGAGAPAPFTLKQYYSGTSKENTSPAAKSLVRFLDRNCR